MHERCCDVLSLMDFYIGTYTRNTDSEGIYHLEISEERHRLSLASIADNPSWITRDKKRGVVYAVSEVNDGNATGGGVSVYQDNRGILDLIESLPSEGDDPCHLCLQSDHLFATNYSSGSVVPYRVSDKGFLIKGERVNHEGSGPDPKRQESAHAHSSMVVNDSLIVADLGMDQHMVYDLDLNRISEFVAPSGAGPRLMAADRNHLYVICELSNTIETYTKGTWEHLGSVSTLPGDFTGATYTAHLQLSKDGRFLYGSNRGHDSVVVFSLEEGLPRPVQWVPSGGRHPRHFTLTEDESMLMIANRDDNNIVLYSRDAGSGLLTGLDLEIPVPAPVCIVQT